LAILKSFIEGFDFVKMKPMNGVIKAGTAIVTVGGRRSSADSARAGGMTVRCLAEPGKQYAVYLRGGTAAQLTLDLPAGKYKAQWVNTKTGKIENDDTIQGSAATRVTAPDYQEDVALRVVRVE
jgi:Putative collagen-binding domain of a collagenase